MLEDSDVEENNAKDSGIEVNNNQEELLIDKQY
jgi:hypothetical protein